MRYVARHKALSAGLPAARNHSFTGDVGIRCRWGGPDTGVALRLGAAAALARTPVGGRVQPEASPCSRTPRAIRGQQR